jgi:serine/threonine protein kinase
MKMNLKLSVEPSESSKSNITLSPIKSAIEKGIPKLPKNYQFIEILGQGAFGQVIKALDTRTDTIVAIKLQRFLEQSNIFEKEIINLKKLADDCDNLACIRESGLFYKKYYIVMDFIQGQTLSKYLEKNKSKIESTFRQIIKTLKKLHSKKFAHMDIKPDNIMVDNNGKVFIVDMGISCFDDKCIGGTNKFLPPDLSFDDISVRERQSADVWAVGKTLARILDVDYVSTDIFKAIVNGETPPPLPKLKISEYLVKVLGLLSVSKTRMSVFRKLK